MKFMFKTAKHLTTSSLLLITIIISLTVLGLTIIITENEGQFDFCASTDNIAIGIKSKSLSEQKDSHCLSENNNDSVSNSN